MGLNFLIVVVVIIAITTTMAILASLIFCDNDKVYQQKLEIIELESMYYHLMSKCVGLYQDGYCENCEVKNCTKYREKE